MYRDRRIPRVAGYTNGRGDINAVRMGRSCDIEGDSSGSDEDEKEEKQPPFGEALKPLRPQQAMPTAQVAVAQAYPPEESSVAAAIFQDQLVASVTVDAPDSPQSECTSYDG